MQETDRLPFSPEVMRQAMRRILRDILIEVGDEFDRNFERQAFFTSAWQRRKSPGRTGGSTLIDTGALRRSLRRQTTTDGVTFSSSLPYAAIHNEGGEIRVTARMKRYFWWRHMTATGALRRKKDGTLRRDKRNVRLTGEAEFWKCMALMKVGSTITIPKRPFIGHHPMLERAVRDIIERRLTEAMRKS